MSYLIVMPVTFLPYGEACLATLDPWVRDTVVVVDQTVTNIGAAGAYNVGAREVLRDGLDWLITLSPSTRFGPSGGRDFVGFLEEHNDDTWIVESLVPTGWHFIAWNRCLFERIGLWDENFWPVYGEDADISYRTLLAIKEDQIPNPWRSFPTDAWLTMQGYSHRIAGISGSQEALWDYYTKKWGGRAGHETFTRPFGDVANPLSFWTPGMIQ